MQSEMIESLKNGVVLLEFEKADGTIRTMYATLNESFIPIVETQSEKTSIRKKSEESQAVWDIEANGWRSFRWDRLRSWETVE